MHCLILGGTSEAAELARLVAQDGTIEALLSLAGRTSAPARSPIPTRSGGFGGVEGLTRWIEDHACAAVVDATHPYAARISANAVAACAALGLPLGLPLASIVRKPWQAVPGDRWQTVATMQAAAEAIGASPRRVFLTVGRLELAHLRAAPQHYYVVRTIDRPHDEELPPNSELVLDRGSFDMESERRLIRERGIEVLVTKNSGGPATYAKVTAARELGLAVVMVERPHKPVGEIVSDPAAAFAWLKARQHDHDGVGSERGV